MLADYNSKPLGGDELAHKVYWTIGLRFYPPPASRHYSLLQLDIFPVGLLYTKDG